MAATIGIESDFPYVKMISAESMIGLGEATKCTQIVKACSSDEDGLLGFDVHSDGHGQRQLTVLARDERMEITSSMNGYCVSRLARGDNIPSDIMASNLGIKQYVPAYLGTELSAFDILTGVSFASGGSGYDPLTSELVQAISMTQQLNLFKEYKQKLKEIAGEKRANAIISKSLYSVITGTDDLANTYFSTPFRSVEYDLPSYIKFVVQCASSFLQELYHLGARKVAVAGVSPIGCLPSQRSLAGGIERECVTRYNEAALMLNSVLAKEIQRLNYTLPGSEFLFVDMYDTLLDMIQHPNAYGFEEVAKGCCGTGIFEVTLTCNRFTAGVCEDVSKYLFWDVYHPTERGYEIMIQKLQTKYSPFFN
ncbi:GDSL esterase/lipase EXL3-like isoform X1 [Zingiber officinale]|uniref:GDSL esterase/lipase EXL3-like isoform X1 n=2 Tax=Zingiber officinale TaxID=94328 RepID=UPI001C4DC9DE|nr:GDSL esterase/lipase EXL3-like isoform X1 [Zingiber officinale]XP_042438217.1 GDSL esterase/lipase EXL3-like isoform X1 [Zingiber officinale]XP_042438218.1 GDSL esterase/lipase EXL3-like isoform X1 [Zingiber officinale]XP_042438220.1 GDSL esterase/lipase EXL3-like isoform X1 [Zingiber officinale]XP_042438221.1 GDSL esterase/lipase EXL3-like isoform X1 [Zingiber officinale]XP_042438222.1 GDSL esterase/lipase EXL3-like isoform X1 [Zingiber officinale]XP_042438223.1 GDSL esterase/lipase EXL3-